MSKNITQSGISIFGLLGIAFVILKLCNVIDWSWWYVTLPFWGGFAFWGILTLFFLLLTVLLHMIKK